jgi:16S rRNA (cytosine1402-N4)-methyltransferase
MSSFSHIPVLGTEAVDWLAPRDGGVYLDGTFGGGGYTRDILSRATCRVVALDRDPEAVARGAALAAEFPDRLRVIEARISQIAALDLGPLDGAVFDFGVSSYQIDDPARGFSFRQDGPLDMRMGDTGPSAADLVNTLPEEELADLIYEYGEEKASRKIAKAIVTRRVTQPFVATADLAYVIRGQVRPDKSGIDTATRSFQALRIAVNEELADISAALAQAAALLAPGGRLVAVSFHSLEDRLVKHFMAGATGRGPSVSRHDPAHLLATPARADFSLLTKSPVAAGEDEVARNPRARSARLRAMERITS